ncbi:maltokinase N-terminal cap-like domain-containing protein [Propionibacteriaceae bacterium G57]|uniref:maltokinase N-terminal cap-like domain-containing protein n=1 Tax=Aestuariimicrobium sp. G57 TaxID=3418485 RepID=UPI003DA717B5
MTRVSVIHPSAVLKPSKVELLKQWLPQQEWFTTDVADLDVLERFRFVDPEGEVGLEVMLLTVGDDIFQVPLTYRGAPRDDADGDDLVGLIDHSVLGTRWVYDGMTDPVFLAELERVIRDADTSADKQAHGSDEVIPPSIDVRGTGVLEGHDPVGELEVVGLVTDEPYEDAAGRLVAVLGEGAERREVVLAVLR